MINLTTKKLARAADYCGVRSGKDVDKWKECHLTRGTASTLKYAPVIEESPVQIECRVKSIQELGSHHMFLAEVTAVQVDESYMDAKGKFDLNRIRADRLFPRRIPGSGEEAGNLRVQCA